MKTLPRFLQVSTVPSDASPWWVALLIHGLTIRFLFKEKPRRCCLVANEAFAIASVAIFAKPRD
jgi:hypothetical protein